LTARAARATPRSAERILVDAGLLIALFDDRDAHHAAAKRWLATCPAALHTVGPVLSEAGFFLPARLKRTLAALAADGTLEVHLPDTAGYARIAQLFEHYRDRDPDWADMELVWLAEKLDIRRIATLDVADFSVYRIHGRVRFELVLLA
jgi:predicted nucleic acid-binding protein